MEQIANLRLPYSKHQTSIFNDASPSNPIFTLRDKILHNSVKNITYSRGGQFKGAKSTILFFVSLALLVTAILYAYNGEYTTTLTILPFFGITLFITADIHGLEVDLEQNKVREYHLTLFGNKGDWMDFKPFTKISLNQKDYNINTADLTTGGSESYTEQHHHFIVEIINPTDNTKLILGENGNFKKALQLLKKASTQLNLEISRTV